MYFWWKKKFIYNKKKNTSITFEVRGVLKWMAVTYYFYKKENIIDQTFHFECPVYLGTMYYFVHPCPTIDTSLLYVCFYLYLLILSIFAGFCTTAVVDLLASVFQPGRSSHHMWPRPQLVGVGQSRPSTHRYRGLCH